MYVRPIYHEWEAWRWAAIISLAAALGLLFATAVGATDVRASQPQLLPAAIQDWARPMGQDVDATVADVPALASERKESEKEDTAVDLGREIWRILELHRTRKHDPAIEAWTELTLPGDGRSQIWKAIAMSQAWIATDRLEDAEGLLSRVLDADPENAVAHYFRGVLRMQQACLAEEWPDDVGTKPTRWVDFTPRSSGPRHVVPNTRSMYQLAATTELEKAIEFASNVRVDEPIVAAGHQTTALEPTVGDLLLAIGAEKFEAKAHNTLSYLFLERGSLEVAEQHMDEAIQGGLMVVYGYRDLGDEYRARGQHQDAARAYLKATKFSSNKLDGLLDALRSFRDSFTNP